MIRGRVVTAVTRGASQSECVGLAVTPKSTTMHFICGGTTNINCHKRLGRNADYRMRIHIWMRSRASGVATKLKSFSNVS